MDNYRQKRRAAFVFALIANLFFVGYVLFIGIRFNGFESIWWWLALLVLLLAIALSVTFTRRLEHSVLYRQRKEPGHDEHEQHQERN